MTHLAADRGTSDWTDVTSRLARLLLRLRRPDWDCRLDVILYSGSPGCSSGRHPGTSPSRSATDARDDTRRHLANNMQQLKNVRSIAVLARLHVTCPIHQIHRTNISPSLVLASLSSLVISVLVVQCTQILPVRVRLVAINVVSFKQFCWISK